MHCKYISYYFLILKIMERFIGFLIGFAASFFFAMVCAEEVFEEENRCL